MTAAPKEEDEVKLRDLIRDVVNRRRRSQPDVIAHAVAKKTPDELLFAFYEEALQPLITDVMRHDRNQVINAIRTQRSTGNGSHPVSANVAAIREVDWSAAFSKRVVTADGWKEIGDCSADNLDDYATNLRQHAANTIDHAEFYEDLAERIRNAGVATARDLKPTDLA
jgi:hypothetical protein